jgi:uncharacterized protein (DUF1810 family)
MERFIKAQDKVYDTIISELESGHKRTHWIWFIFPQIQGLGRSETAKFYAIRDKEEAEEYLNHPILGKRLIECSTIVANASAYVDFPYPDDLKLKSSMTLFSLVSENEIFKSVLDKYFSGELDPLTVDLLIN